MNWDDLRIFLAIARHGSLSAAARALGVNQSTVSRRLQSLERALGVRLVEREAGVHALSTAGQDIEAAAERIEEVVRGVERRVAGRDAGLSGRIRLTCVDMMADRFLAPHLAAFSACHPGIDLDLLTPMAPLDMLRHEADVALRVSADPPGFLYGRRLCGFALAAYVARHGDEHPDPGAIDWIGWDGGGRNIVDAAFSDARIRHRADGLLAAAALVRAGLGASVLPCYWADRDAALERLYPDPVAGQLALWVLVHPDVRRLARVKALVSWLTRVCIAQRDSFEGRTPGISG